MAGNKHSDIMRLLKEDIAAGKFVDRLPGVHVLAKEYGANFKTITKAVNRLEAEGVVQSRPGEGRFLVEQGAQPTRPAALVFAKTMGHFYETRAAYLAREIQAAGFLPVVIDAERLSEGGAGTALPAGLEPRGIVVDDAAAQEADTIRRIAGKRTRVVALGAAASSSFPGSTSVLTDYRQAAHAATAHLLALGHARVMTVIYRWLYSDSEHEGSAHDATMKGYVAALTEEGLEAHQRFYFFDGDPDKTIDLRESFADEATRPTALFCFNDKVATVAIRQCKQMGLRVPQDVAVVGAFNTPWCEWAEVPLTSVSYREDEIARAAARALTASSKGIQNAVVNAEVVIRESCGYRLKRGESDGASAAGLRMEDGE